jgi:hypothetical protein
LPLVTAANYLVMATRHEAAHGLVVLAFGGEIADVHVWPPRGANLSWITFRLPLAAPPQAVWLQAVAPFVVAVALIAAGIALARRLPSGILRANLALTLVVFPCVEIVANAVGYWYAPNDLFWVLGGRTPQLRWMVVGGSTVIVTTALAGLLATLAVRRPGPVAPSPALVPLGGA